jgi:2'-5' RNA ligase
MPRVRLAVVLYVPRPLRDEVEGLRRAFGDPARERIGAHITLVPPVNVQVPEVPDALAVVQAAAARARPLDLDLGPIEVFPGGRHVAYLAVHGRAEALDALHRLRSDVLQGPLERPSGRDFVPHVTVTRGLDTDRLAAVLDAAIDFRDAPMRVDLVHLVQEQQIGDRRRWTPIADARLAG